MAASEIAFITGAGISEAAGIPTFREGSGEYNDPDIASALDKEVFEHDPERVWDALFQLTRVYRERNVASTAGHLAIAQLEQSGASCQIITQNIDDFHERAGSSEVFHLHGTVSSAYCPCCTTTIAIEASSLFEAPVCDNDSCPSSEPAILHPGVVLKGERPRWQAQKALEQLPQSELETLYLVGTQATYPYIRRAIERVRTQTDSDIIEINPHETPVSYLAHTIVRAKADEALPDLLLQ